MDTTKDKNSLLQPKIISMEVDDEDSYESEYRLQIGTQIKYLVINPGTYDRDTLSFPLSSLPPLQYDVAWTVANISRSPTGSLLTSLSTLSCLDLERTEQLTAAAYEAVPSSALAATLTASPVIFKIARFESEIPRLEQETRAYKLLEGSGLAPRFLGHMEERASEEAKRVEMEKLKEELEDTSGKGGGLNSTPSSRQQQRRPPSQNSHQPRRNNIQRKAPHNIVRGAMDDAMPHTRGNIRPSETRVGLVPPRDRQHRRHGIELRGLLEEVREVVGLPAHGWGDHLVDFLVREVVLFGDAEPRVHGEAIGEHPAFDDEGPGV
ncbi:hypothetical protein V490_08012 [Pseudogymnoascus sp. VKM F-3557]|nr:hypothetical protein V490_08012 [Pseudogymnoascus sp. VKM F-3557]